MKRMRMKNLLRLSCLLLVALLMVSSLVACDGNKQDAEIDDDGGSKKANAEATISFSVTYQGVSVELGKPMASVLEALGSPNSISEAPSCGDGTTRMRYSYSSLRIYTLTVNGEETIDEIELLDDVPETAAKISIGSSESDVRSAYGTPTSEEDGILTYISGKNELTIVISDGKVSDVNFFRNTK